MAHRLGAPLEYLNFLSTGHYASVGGFPEKQTALWRSLLHRRTSPNGVFGVKAFPTMVEQLAQRNPALFREITATLLGSNPNPRIVQVKQRDRIAHAISYARAKLSGIWRSEQESGEPASLDYSPAAIDDALDVMGREEAGWDMLFANMKIEPLVLWYEATLERPAEAVQEVADYFAVRLNPAAAIRIPEIKRQSQTDAAKWAERHSQGR